MKNKLYYVLIGLVVSFSFIINVFAADLNFTVSADPTSATVVKGEETTIKLNLKSDEVINTCRFKLESDSNIVFVSKSGANGWNVTEEGTLGFLIENSLSSTDSLSNGKNILELRYIVNGDGKVTIKTQDCVSTVTEKKGSYNDVVVNFTAKDISSDTTLSSLSVTGGNMSTFSSTKRTYPVKLDGPNFSLNMTASNPNYQDKIVISDSSGNKYNIGQEITFTDENGAGQMLIQIVVNGDTSGAYELLLSYENPELDGTLRSLSVNGDVINLVDGVFQYEYTVAKDVNSVDVRAVLKDSENFSFAAGNSPGTFNLSGNEHDLALIIEPKDIQSGGQPVTYLIKIKREGSAVLPPSSSSQTPVPSTPTYKPTSNPGGNISSNPTTGGISMFIMAFILVASFVCSVLLYKKNLESYK